MSLIPYQFVEVNKRGFGGTPQSYPEFPKKPAVVEQPNSTNKLHRPSWSNFSRSNNLGTTTESHCCERIDCDRDCPFRHSPSGMDGDRVSTLTEYAVTVLLIDDQPMIGEVVRRMLAPEEDIIFHYCDNPTQAINMAMKVKPTVIIQDLIMPEVDGLLLLRFLRANVATRDIPTIVLSSKEDPKLKAEAFTLGANDYLVKFPDKIEFIARIRCHSKAYTTLLQRNEAYQAMQVSLAQLEQERHKSEQLLQNILPEPIAERLKDGQEIIAESYSDVSVLFADLVGFTQLSSSVSPIQLVHLLNQIFSKFDLLAEKHGLEKIKTIGDAYMVVSGLPTKRADHADAIAEMAVDMQVAMREFNAEAGANLKIRVGIHSGSAIAGIIGTKKFTYDLWGDTVNIASRMESHGLPDYVHLSQATYERLSDRYILEQRGVIEVKGKGEMMTYFLIGRK
jgi:adenylate cyclase